jgi:NAD(P)-dependent dehydrogenase (short-subunit alcohol dehydrogenase family)
MRKEQVEVTDSEPVEGIDLAGQVAIVTGGGRGIGRAIAQALAEAGAAVAVVSRTESELAETVRLIEEAGGRAVAYPADVTDQAAIEQVVAEVERTLGPIDLLVNNAGDQGPCGPIWESAADEWWRCVEVNLRGPYLCSRAVLPVMTARHQGRIITTASGAGLWPWPYMATYAVGKCAAVRFSENLAAETRDLGISAFAIHPGFVRTPMTETLACSPEEEKWLNGMFRKALAAGRDVPLERAAQLVLELASGRADVLSGCFISVNDDVAEMVSRADEIREGQLYRLRLSK